MNLLLVVVTSVMMATSISVGSGLLARVFGVVVTVLAVGETPLTRGPGKDDNGDGNDNDDGGQDATDNDANGIRSQGTVVIPAETQSSLFISQ